MLTGIGLKRWSSVPPVRLMTRAAPLPLLAILLAGQGAAAPVVKPGAISYAVVKGDTLYMLARRYFVRLADFSLVRRLNRVSDPRRLQVGRVLRIPRPLLREEPVLATIRSYRGAVRVERAGRPAAAAIGMIVREGDLIETGEQSFITIALPDRSVVTMPSGSRVRIRRLHRIALTGSVERLFEVEAGRARATVTPMRDPYSNFRVSTPVAVSAVRGTEFRVGYDPGDHRMMTEVLRGKVGVSALSADRAETAVPEGFGVAAGAAENDGAVRLLPAPELASPARVQDGERLRFAVKPLGDAVAYRIQIAPDADLLDILDETSSPRAEAELPGQPNGSYFVRVAAIDRHGLEGMPATYSFERRLNRIAASVEQRRAGRYRQYLFRWETPDAPRARYRFQLSADPEGGTPLIDETGLTTRRFVVTDLPGGTYYWRVMTLQFEGGRIYETWTPFRQLRIAIGR